ncbi:MAG: glycoside hydrolase family 2 [Ruminococcaceae bacterium]|nr:glycoside hydrolase family 2 [Oscillospiraceae bacterium]
MLYTRWGKELDKSCPLSEYPRPQFVRDSYLSLNGEWDLNFCKEGEEKTEYEYKITVPFSPETPLSGVGRELQKDERLIYRKQFTLPDGFNKGRVILHFGAVDQIAHLKVNDRDIFTHEGGYTPFEMEITDCLADGENELIVTVEDYCEDNEYLRGKQRTKRGGIWYSPQSGIWQSVWLESVPQEYIKSVRITPDYDKEQVHFDFIGCEGVNIRIYDGNDMIADTNDSTVKIPDFKPWSPESPFLYDVVFTYGKDRVKSYFGMRKFSTGIDKNGVKRLFLNNEPYFHNGLLDQGYYPDGYLTPPSNAAMEYDVKTVKALGFNMLRKHIKIEPLLWYHYCDKNGIIVWQDMVNGGGNYGLEVSAIPFIGITLDDTKHARFHRTSEKAMRLYYQELDEMLSHLYNCPCIAVWVPFNEGWGQFDSVDAYRHIKAFDSTRIVDTTSGWHDMGASDVISKHIYFTPIKVKAGNRPYVLSEFGGLSTRVTGHTWGDRMFGYKIYKTCDTLTKAYNKLFNKVIIPQIKDGLSATVYTQVTDVEDELNGLMTYDREVLKVDAETIKEINERVKV